MLFDIVLLFLIFVYIYRIGMSLSIENTIIIPMGAMMILFLYIVVKQYVELGSDVPYLFDSDPELYYSTAKILSIEGTSSIQFLGGYVYFGDLGLRHVSYVIVLAAAMKLGATIYGLHLLNLLFLFAALLVLLNEVKTLRSKRLFTLLFLSTGSILSLSMILLKEAFLIYLVALVYRSLGVSLNLRKFLIYLFLFLTRPFYVLILLPYEFDFIKSNWRIKSTLLIFFTVLIAVLHTNVGYWDRLDSDLHDGGVIYSWSRYYSNSGVIFKLLSLPLTGLLSVLGPLDVFRLNHDIYYRFFQITCNILWLLIYVPFAINALMGWFSKRLVGSLSIEVFVINLVYVSLIFGGTMHRYVVPFIPIFYVGILNERLDFKSNISVTLAFSFFVFIVVLYASR